VRSEVGGNGRWMPWWFGDEVLVGWVARLRGWDWRVGGEVGGGLWEAVVRMGCGGMAVGGLVRCEVGGCAGLGCGVGGFDGWHCGGAWGLRVVRPMRR
jgi:hypothetical protein